METLMPVIRTPSGAGKMFLYPVCSYNRHVIQYTFANPNRGVSIIEKSVPIVNLFGLVK